ncbi:transporter substrate-binding domain-containing protein [Thalassotalea euphylliae]|uniref:Diguanylate cyclase n=1 Tax=Thalassotalea euphylliae TaxID=1655234 RepID=A0A3E0TK63_9GAMM|nr:transporter substrate-binding domain-containing protein [Thalassotalea euphylliae]REL24365.1 diguanylate cyclase [Thalassotalea euphylliae]
MDFKKVSTFIAGVLWLITIFSGHVLANNQTESPTKSVSQQSFKIAIYQQNYPYQYINATGQPSGILIDFWRLWAEKQGVDVSFHGYSWAEGLAAVANQQVDFHAGLLPSDTRKHQLLRSNALYPHDSFVYLDSKVQDAITLSQIAPYKVGAVNGLVNLEILTADNNISVQLFQSRPELYDAVLNGELLAFVEQGELDNSYPRIKELGAIFPQYKRLNYFTGDYSAAVANDNVELLNYINQGLAKITLAERVDIEKKFLNMAPEGDVLNLGFAGNLPPYMGYSASGQPQGLFIDMWRLWAKHTGHQVNFVGDSLNRSFTQLVRGSLDAHIAYTSVFDENSGLQKSAKVYSLSSQVFVSNRVPNITSLEQLNGKVVGVFKAAPYVDSVTRQYPEISYRMFSELAEMIAAAERGEIDAAISEVETMQVKLVNANLQGLFYLLDQPAFPIDIFAVVAKGDTQLMRDIEQGFASIPRKDLHMLESIWLKEHASSHFSLLEPKIPLTEQQQHWVQENPVLKVGITKDWEPLEFIGEDGQPLGINRDVIESVTQSAGFELEFVAYDHWAALVAGFRDNEIDLILGVSSANSRAPDFDFTDSYWQMPWSIIYRRILGRINSLADLNGKTLAIVKGYQLTNWVKANYPEIDVVLVNSTTEGVLAVQQGFVDGFVEGLPVASKLAKQESIVPLEVAVVPEFPSQDSRIGIHKGNHVLQGILNQGLSTIDDKKRQEIFNRWFDINIHSGWDKRLVTRVATQVGFVIFAIILFVVLWNRRLHKEVGRRKALEMQMKHMATHDELTGLANRTLIKTQMDTAIALHQRQGLKLAVMFVDLDGFKAVNDKYGHDFGDVVLQQVAERLTSCVRKSDTVCRFGGDEFVVLLTSLNNKEEAAFIAEKIINLIAKPFIGNQIKATLGASIGISVFPDDSDSAADLFKMADNLMYRVKSSGKNNYSYL